MFTERKRLNDIEIKTSEMYVLWFQLVEVEDRLEELTRLLGYLRPLKENLKFQDYLLKVQPVSMDRSLVTDSYIDDIDSVHDALYPMRKI